ncbi:heavy metal-associated isoprenylated plant protein 32-like [Nymphaea colorata]|nr:heavy metal-associated isoprenylated plant protein 32-like [Nymphaea colorata]
MTKSEDIFKIQTCILKVNIHCDGCKDKVRKLLQKIEGVLRVTIDAEQQKVTVFGSVDSDTLIKKLIRSGKHAELWSQKGNNQQQQHHHHHQQQQLQQQHHYSQKMPNQHMKDDRGMKDQKHGLFMNRGAKNQQKPLGYISDDDLGDESDDEADEDDDGLGFLREKASKMNFHRQQPNEVGVGKKNKGNISNGSPNGGNVGKKGGGGGNNGGNQHQNVAFKGAGGGDQKNQHGGDQKNQHGGGGGGPTGFGQNMRMNNGQHAGFGSNAMEGRNGMGFGYQGVGGIGGGAGGALGLGMGIQGHNGIQGCGYPMGVAGYYGGGGGGAHLGGYGFSNAAYQQHPMTMMSNINSRPNQNHNQMLNERYMQMMYNRSPLTPLATTSYYNYQPQSQTAEYATYLFSDDNTSSCAIM